MADTKGNDPKSGPDQAAAARSAAVKPPVLDLTARETKPEPAKPASSGSDTVPPAASKVEPKPASADKASIPVPPATPKTPPAAMEADRPFPIGATLAGGVIGLAAAYGLALAGLWPATPAAIPAADPRLAQFASAIPELETVTQTTQSELAALNQRMGALEATTPVAANAAAPVDLSALEADIAALGERIDAVSATTTPAAEPDTSAQLETELAALTSQLSELGARLGSAEASLRTLDTAVSQTTETLANQPGDIGAVLQLPLVLSGLETAFASGRPYETELAALRAASPDAAIPTVIANAASSGLARPDAIAQQFEEVLPAIIAGRPANPDAQWQDGALDWFASAIALRPTGEFAGDTPEAIVSRLEGAIARRDFAAAQILLNALPQPMQTAAGDLSALVAAQAEAALFLETVRTDALAGGAAQ